MDKIFFIQNMGLMVKTGFSMSDALESLALQTKHKLFATTIMQLHHDVIAGETLANAMRKHPAVFEDLLVNMISAGEVSGNLEQTLQQLAVQLKKSYALRRKVRNAMIYPMLIFTVMIVVGVGVFTFVVPRILDLYTSNNYVLPLPTQIVLWVSKLFEENLLWFGFGAVVFVMAFVVTWRSKAGRRVADRIILHLPIVGGIVKKVMIAKFTRLLHSLIVTDIPIVKSFQIIAPTLGNAEFRDYIAHSTEQLSKGGDIHSTMLARPDLFNPVIGQMIRVGEQSGQLDTIAEEIAIFYEDDVDSVMSNLSVIIEPILMVCIGFGVGFLAVAIIMPIYALVDQI